MQAVRSLQLVVDQTKRERVSGVADHSSWIADAFAWNAQVPMDYLDVKPLRGGFVALDIVPSGERLGR